METKAEALILNEDPLSVSYKFNFTLQGCSPALKISGFLSVDSWIRKGYSESSY